MGKYEPKTKPGAQSVGEYLAALDDPARRDEAERIDAMLRRVTGEEPRLWGPSMIGYGQYHYRYDSGHEGDAMRIGFAPRKAELVLYILGVDPEDQAKEDALLARLGKHRTGKCCLYVRRLDQVDEGVLEELAALSWQTMARRYPA